MRSVLCECVPWPYVYVPCLNFSSDLVQSTPPAYPTLDDSSIELPPGWIVRPNQLGEKCYFNVNTKESSKEDPRSRIVSQTVENREYVVMTKVVVIEGRNLANPVETTCT